MVRRNTGYLRYDKPEHVVILNELFTYLNLYANYFQPIMILLEKHREGSKSIRKYDKPQTPYQRLMNHNKISSEIKQMTTIIYDQLNPAELRRKIDNCQSKLVQTASAATRKQALPEKIRKKKSLKHTLPKGRRQLDPFLEKERQNIIRKALNSLDDERRIPEDKS